MSALVAQCRLSAKDPAIVQLHGGQSWLTERFPFLGERVSGKYPLIASFSPRNSNKSHPFLETTCPEWQSDPTNVDAVIPRRFVVTT